MPKPLCLRCLGREIDPVSTPGGSMIACRACGGRRRADETDIARAEAEYARECALAHRD